ncbi:MAG: hypothetical protein KF753_17240 [Caldilineaceae bacterium]|nr:hypothetical protein [Caldilineaceae bacterium]
MSNLSSLDTATHTPSSSSATADTPAPGNENPLSEREMDVARLLVTGASNGDIANDLIISPHTVKVHLRNIYEKLAVNSRTEASMLLVSQGWISVPGVDTAESQDVADPLEPTPLNASAGVPFGWQPVYLILAFVSSLGLLFTPFFTRPVQSIPNLLSDGDAMALGRPLIAELPRWESRAPLSTARSRLALVGFNDVALYAIGGESSQGQPTASVDIYDLRTNEWRTGPALPLPLANLATAANGRLIFVAGGDTVGSSAAENGTTESSTSGGDSAVSLSDLLLTYAPETDIWSEWGRLPLPLAGASLVLVGDDLYLLGGWDGQAMRDEVWRIALARGPGIDAGAWETVTHLKRAASFAGAVAVENDLYVVGGYDGRQELGDARVYDTATGNWRDMPDLATARGGIALLYDGLALFAVGGGWTQSVDTIERFDPATGLWSNFPAPISGEWRHLGGAANSLGQLYLIGGWSGSYLDVHLRYQSSFRTFFPSTKKDVSPSSPQR